MAILGFESLAVSSAAVNLTAATYLNAWHATISVEGGAVRYRPDNTNPTASVGHALEVGDVLVLESADAIQRATFIRRDGTDATLSVTYEV